MNALICFCLGDDSCNVDQCGNDLTDCHEDKQCAEGTVCRQIYRFWNFLGDGNQWNTTTFCDGTLWTIFTDKLRVDLDWWMTCDYFMNRYDFNDDGFVNYRELTALGYTALYDKFYDWGRASQVNCSFCWGMDDYNI